MHAFRAVALSAALALPGPASAAVEIVGEIDGTQGAHGKVGDDDAGFGVAVRTAWLAKLAGLWLGPELVLQYANPDGLAQEVEDGQEGEAWGLRFAAGGRLGFGEMVRPHLFAHVGYGAYLVPGGPAYYGHSVPDRTFDGLSWDAGLGLDFAMPGWLIGIHAAYTDIADEVGWVGIGLHAGARL